MSNLYHQDIYKFDEPVKSYWESTSNTKNKYNKLEKNIQTNIYDDIDKCIQYVEFLKEDLSLPTFVRHSRTNEDFVICIMDMCFKTKAKERASLGDLTALLSSISI